MPPEPPELAFVLITATWRGIRIQTAVGRIALRFVRAVRGVVIAKADQRSTFKYVVRSRLDRHDVRSRRPMVGDLGANR